jgi:hypothetical protein
VKARVLGRAGAWVAGAWAGLMIGVGAVAAPVLFSLLPRAEAGRVAARLFSLEATIGICAGAVLVLVGLQLGRDRAERADGSRFGIELILALGAVACIVAGHYAVQPMIEAARTGQGSLPFAALHGIALGFFGLRLVLVAILAWRLSVPPG